jgi:hypothetical protein
MTGQALRDPRSAADLRACSAIPSVLISGIRSVAAGTRIVVVASMAGTFRTARSWRLSARGAGDSHVA